MVDEGERVRARFEYKVVIEGENFPSILLFTVELGLNSEGEAALHFRLLEGNDFYLRVAEEGIRQGCFP